MASLSLITIFLALSLTLFIQALAGESAYLGTSSLGEYSAPSPSDGTEHSSSEGTAEAPAIRRLGKHHSSDKSVAGGGVILGGLVTAIFAAVFCYIRVTRKRINGGQVGH